MTKEILDFFKLNDVKYKENLSLSSISPIKIGGKARFVAYPDTQDKLIRTLDFLGNAKIKHKILGRMSNVLPPDIEYNGVVIRTDLLSDFVIKGRFVEAYTGASLPIIAKKSADSGLSGFEELSGIPGSLGGAIRGNAGSFGREISDLVSRVTVYNRRKAVVEHYKADRINFAYRSSSFMDKDIFIISASLLLSRADKFFVNSMIQAYREKRTATQPVGQPSLGSTFKKPSKDLSAAALIDSCGLKGLKIGGAKISEKHAGFIVNAGGATADDYLRLSKIAMNSVYKEFGIMLEKEIEVI